MAAGIVRIITLVSKGFHFGGYSQWLRLLLCCSQPLVLRPPCHSVTMSSHNHCCFIKINKFLNEYNTAFLFFCGNTSFVCVTLAWNMFILTAIAPQLILSQVSSTQTKSGPHTDHTKNCHPINSGREYIRRPAELLQGHQSLNTSPAVSSHGDKVD